jgi:hypothetical protein
MNSGKPLIMGEVAAASGQHSLACLPSIKYSKYYWSYARARESPREASITMLQED